jgi:hypothetical protein
MHAVSSAWLTHRNGFPLFPGRPVTPRINRANQCGGGGRLLDRRHGPDQLFSEEIPIPPIQIHRALA